MALVEQVEHAGGGRRRLRLANPATLAPLGEIEVGIAADVHAAVESARKAQHAWADLPFEARGRILQRAARVILERHDEIVEIMSDVNSSDASGTCA